jgi:hypothetical protein
LALVQYKEKFKKNGKKNQDNWTTLSGIAVNENMK